MTGEDKTRNGLDPERGEELDMDKAGETTQAKDKLDILYKVDECPPFPLLVLLGFQQFLTMFGATFSFPLLMSSFLCMTGDTVGLGHLISTVIFVAGLSTIIQTVFGIRLAIIQSVSYSFVTPFIVLLSLPKWACKTCVTEPDGVNIECGSDAHAEEWQARLRELQGAVLVSSVLQITVGFTGVVGVLMAHIGPLTITPTIAMIGLSLFDAAAGKAQGQWWIALLTVALVALFSQYMRNINLPMCGWQRDRGCFRSSLRFFALFPVILAVCLSWLLCYILTVTDVLPSPQSKGWGYLARTDVQGDVIGKAPWFRIPYPGQWGVPTVSVEGVLGCLAAVVASIIESVGDYYACARLSGAPPPPGSAVTRGIGVEGITCLFAGAWGSGAGTTSYSENIGAIGITKVGSRAVVQMSGVLMIIMACVGKFSAIFVAIPEPVVGGLFIVMFGMVTAVGISNLQYVDLNSSRNLFILGLSLFLGLSVPKWLAIPANAGVIDTGSSVVDNIFTVLCSTSMFVAGVVAFVLDNTIPGTPEERGIHTWRLSEGSEKGEHSSVYDLPCIQPWLDRLACTRYLPFCPRFAGWRCRRHHSGENREGSAETGLNNQGYETGGGGQGSHKMNGDGRSTQF